MSQFNRGRQMLEDYRAGNPEVRERLGRQAVEEHDHYLQEQKWAGAYRRRRGKSGNPLDPDEEARLAAYERCAKEYQSIGKSLRILVESVGGSNADRNPSPPQHPHHTHHHYHHDNYTTPPRPQHRPNQPNLFTQQQPPAQNHFNPNPFTQNHSIHPQHHQHTSSHQNTFRVTQPTRRSLFLQGSSQPPQSSHQSSFPMNYQDPQPSQHISEPQDSYQAPQPTQYAYSQRNSFQIDLTSQQEASFAQNSNQLPNSSHPSQFAQQSFQAPQAHQEEVNYQGIYSSQRGLNYAQDTCSEDNYSSPTFKLPLHDNCPPTPCFSTQLTEEDISWAETLRLFNKLGPRRPPAPPTREQKKAGRLTLNPNQHQNRPSQL